MVVYNNTHYNQTSTLENYDLCRHVPNNILSTFAKHIIDLTKKSSRNNKGNILEEGVGNGRVLIPVIEESRNRRRKDTFYAIDKSRIMLDDLRKRLNSKKSIRYKIDLGDIQEELPYKENFFDCVYTFAVYHILNKPENALEQTLKVMKKEGYFVFSKEFNQVFHGTEKKIELADSPDFKGVALEPRIQSFFHKYHELRDEFEVPFKPSGVLYSDSSLVNNYLISKGLHHYTIKEDLSWKKPHTFRQMLDAFRLRNITTFGSDISDPIRIQMYTELMEWCKKENITLDEVINIPANIALHIFSK